MKTKAPPDEGRRERQPAPNRSKLGWLTKPIRLERHRLSGACSAAAPQMGISGGGVAVDLEPAVGLGFERDDDGAGRAGLKGGAAVMRLHRRTAAGGVIEVARRAAPVAESELGRRIANPLGHVRRNIEDGLVACLDPGAGDSLGVEAAGSDAEARFLTTRAARRDNDELAAGLDWRVEVAGRARAVEGERRVVDGDDGRAVGLAIAPVRDSDGHSIAPSPAAAKK